MNRTELRRRLRDKCEQKRLGGTSSSSKVSRHVSVPDELLARGVDDPTLLTMATKLGKNPRQAAAALRNLSQIMSTTNEPKVNHTREKEEEDEEPPSCETACVVTKCPSSSPSYAASVEKRSADDARDSVLGRA